MSMADHIPGGNSRLKPEPENRAGWFTSSAIAMTNLDDWNFLQPLHIGDTVTMEMEIVAKRVVSTGDKGIIDREFTLFNQHGEAAQRGRSGMLIKLAA